ncbi:MAG TPA: cytochrome c [Bryobacteraceae bacterium]|nr:cytochrome c [Bryobacteraceae bacterium]
MKRFWIGLLIGILLVPAFGYVYLRMGWAPASTSAPPLPFEKRIASMALNAAIDKAPPATPDIPQTEGALMEGAKVYRDYCAMCHGIGSEPKSPAARGMYPPPPQLLHGKGVSDDPIGETYWKVTNGIRLTGMPAYKDSLTGSQLWQVSMFLASSDKLPPAVTEYLNSPAR